MNGFVEVGASSVYCYYCAVSIECGSGLFV